MTKTPYFWRTQKQQEIDLVEECDGRLSAFEFKLFLVIRMQNAVALTGINSLGMFDGCSNLTGGRGTKYSNERPTTHKAQR